MGGLAGHMSHLYENGNLTFEELKDVLKQASRGNLKGTEKTDGQNIKLSFLVKKQTALGARNSSHIKQGGLSKQEMASFFSDHQNPNLKLVFSDALSIFEKAVKLLDTEKQIELFGPNADIWYNAEVLDDRTRNIINYDTRNLVIHRDGHYQYDKETGKILEDDSGEINKKSAKFMNFLEKVQNKVSDKRHSILVSPIQNLKALTDKEALRTAINNIDVILSKYNLNDSNTINDLLKRDLNVRIKTKLPEQIKERIISNILQIGEKTNKRDLKKDLNPELKQEIDDIINNSSTYLKQAIKPIELIITDFASEMLKGLNSIFILDNKTETERMSEELEKAINSIQSSGNKGDLDFLNNQLEKIKSSEKVSSVVEGFVFSYKGHTYKFTGRFAPINQILGLLKYGKRSKNQQELTEESDSLKKYDIALLGGGFKPPHKGHIELIKQLSSKADRVIILTSDKSSKERKFKTGILKDQIIDGSKSNSILKKYISSLPNLSNVEIKITNSPLKDIFEYVEKEAKYGESILLGVSDKDEDTKRFANIRKYIPQNSNIKVDIEVLKPISFNGDILSSSRMREIISNNNLKQLIDFIPNEIPNKSDFAQEILDLFLKKDVNEISSMGSGAITLGTKLINNKDLEIRKFKNMKNIDRKQFMEEMQLRKTIRKALLLREKNKGTLNKDEEILRTVIRDILKEAKRDINYGNTGLNVLADLLGGSFRDGLTSVYKNLETEKSQRDNFKNKFLELTDKLFNEADMNIEAGINADKTEDSDSLEEEVNISLDGEEDKIIPDFVYGDKKKETNKKSSKEDKNIDKAPYEIKAAVDFFNSWKDEIETKYSSLDNTKDRKMYRDYFMANVPAMLDVAESEISKESKPVDITPSDSLQNTQKDTVLPDQETAPV